ncbi:Short-chain dehydrogenase/reductase SDR [Paenibacillus pasadenensis]|uniref:Short-chain dehydrogenase/reductase SDR n=1 Tax=Paenibacillus pasadenensis TaxID=217090 RepID=A0A2N5N3M7_9BACL|nr:SDR family oxidoreductase [Paenibacillus pasadenensis]PLT44948.1 Short-chain dehydrogenase/reductase SDR [Paenibacillus pasadenensis]
MASSPSIVCITGASSGIGLATALRLAGEGHAVYAGTRHPERDQAAYAGTPNLTFLEMEVTDPASLERAFRLIDERHGKLDALFCNAGYGMLRTLEQADMEDVRRLFETNVFGVMSTIRAALPLLKRSDNGYVLVTSSVGGLVGQPFNELYCSSKFALEGLLESLATYYKPAFNIDVTLIEPGAVATAFSGTVMDQVSRTGGILEDEYKPLLTRYLDRFASRTSVPQTGEDVAGIVSALLAMEEKPLRVRTSEAAEAFARFKTMQDPDGLQGLRNTRKLHLDLE